MPRPAVRLLLALCLASAAAPAAAQVDDQSAPMQAEFHFARLAFGINGRSFTESRGEPWLRDWPDAEFHFLEGVNRMTSLDADGEFRQVSLTSDALYDYPVLYAVKVGYWYLSDPEIERLREYLERGGFLIVDDFHGPGEWEQFAFSMRRVFPDRPIVDIPDEHEIFHVLYDLDDRQQIPGRNSVYWGVTWEHPLGRPEYWRGIADDAGRLVVAINFNMDLGDAWEHADDAFYPEPMTALAYRIGINYLIYALTH
ncbi:MAG: DUF4159 domain-containing protein [Woeseiaceae bacterium]|nr:DUF4159 domain-containing protein [Woeseiaceae bacterium]